MKKIIPIIIGLILLQLCKYGLTQSFYIAYGESRGEFYLDKSSNEIMNEDYDDLMTALNAIPFKTKKTKMNYRDIVPVKVIGTNHLFGQIEPLKIIHGSFFAKGALTEQRNVVVISETLSQKLYNTSNSIGNSCVLEGISYEVVGVYKKYAHFYQYFLDDGLEKVYLPHSNKILREVAFESIIFTEEDSKWKVKIIYFTKMLYSYQYLVPVIIAGLMIKKWFIYSFQKGKAYIIQMQKQLKKDYLKRVLLKEYRNVLLHVLRMGLGVFVLYALWYYITFKGDILEPFLYGTNGIIKALQQYNTALSYTNTTFNRAYVYLKLGLVCLSLLQLYLGFKTSRYGN